MQADKTQATLPQTTVFVWIFLQICSDDEERMDDFKPVMMIVNLRYMHTACVHVHMHTCMHMLKPSHECSIKLKHKKI